MKRRDLFSRLVNALTLAICAPFYRRAVQARPRVYFVGVDSVRVSDGSDLQIITQTKILNCVITPEGEWRRASESDEWRQVR